MAQWVEPPFSVDGSLSADVVLAPSAGPGVQNQPLMFSMMAPELVIVSDAVTSVIYLLVIYLIYGMWGLEGDC